MTSGDGGTLATGGQPDRPRVLAVLGPTASGKSALAVQMAQACNGEVINCDSRQVYRELSIGTARPTPAEMGGVAHHLFDLVDPDRPFSAGQWQASALAVIAGLHARGRVAVVCGGTGLYFQTLLEGLPEGDEPDPALRQALGERLQGEGLAALVAELARHDPAAPAALDCRNPRRVLRALELVLGSGRPLAEARQRRPIPTLRLLPLLVTRPPDQLAARIAARTAAMLAVGLEAEVRDLFARHGPLAPALLAIGYREWLPDLLAGRQPDPTAIGAAISLHSRQYARRQLQWFRRRPGGTFADLDDPTTAPALLAAGRRFADATE